MRTNLFKALVASLLTCGAVGVAQAGVFDAADAQFALREGNPAAVAAARAEYVRVGGTTRGADLAYAVQQIGRVNMYEGLYLLPDTGDYRARRTQLFSECRDWAAKLAGDASQITIYAYWRMTCTAQWMKYASLAERLTQLPEIKRYFNEMIDPDLEIKATLGIDGRYFGGGMARVLAAIYANQLSSLLRDGLPNGAKAAVMIDRAIRAEPLPGWEISGADYYANYRHQAEVLQFNGQAAPADQVLADAVAEIEELIAENVLPIGFEAETRGELALMQAAKKQKQ